MLTLTAAILAAPVALGTHALDIGLPWPVAFALFALTAALEVVAPVAIVAAPVCYVLDRRAARRQRDA